MIISRPGLPARPSQETTEILPSPPSRPLSTTPPLPTIEQAMQWARERDPRYQKPEGDAE